MAANRGQQTIENSGGEHAWYTEAYHCLSGAAALYVIVDGSRTPTYLPLGRFPAPYLLRNRQRRKRRNRRTKSRSIDGEVQETTCQKSALTFATYCVHPVSDGDREQVKITRREENGTEPGARRSEKGTEKPRRNRLHRTPTSRRIRRRAARTYDRLRFGAGDTTVRQSAALRTESSGAIPAPSGNRAIPGIATGDCQRPSSSASAAIVATP